PPSPYHACCPLPAMWTGISRPRLEIIVPEPSNTSFHKTAAVLNCFSTLGLKTFLKIGSAALKSNCGTVCLLYLLVGRFEFFSVDIAPDGVLPVAFRFNGSAIDILRCIGNRLCSA